MTTRKAYTVTIYDEYDAVLEDATFYEKEVEQCGGIGNIVEALSKFRKDEEYIKVGFFYTGE